MAARIEGATFPDTPCESMSEDEHIRFIIAEVMLHEWLVARIFGGPRPPDFHGGFHI
jgi:hypothetical protein